MTAAAMQLCGRASACVISMELQANTTRTLALRFGAVHLPQRMLDCLPEQLLCLQLCHRHESVPDDAHAQWSQAMVCDSIGMHSDHSKAAIGLQLSISRPHPLIL